MAQNFRRYTSNNVGTGVATVLTADSYDTVVGISVCNVASATINVDVYINDGNGKFTKISDTDLRKYAKTF